MIPKAKERAILTIAIFVIKDSSGKAKCKG
jgi:hypothetical protein